jgi:hypothetical protein
MTNVVVFFFFATTEPWKNMMSHWCRFFCCNKTKTKEGDGNITFSTLTKKIFAIVRPKQKATTTFLLSLSMLQKKKLVTTEKTMTTLSSPSLLQQDQNRR